MHRLLLLADLVLDQVGVEHRIGDVDVLAADVLVVRAVGDVGARRRRPVDHHRRAAFVTALRRCPLTIRPDLALVRDDAVLAVADVKYKLLDGGAAPNPDVYQVITNCTRPGLDTGQMIYASPSAIPE